MAGKLQVERMDGELKASGLRFGIVVSRFNNFITERLLAASVDALERAGAARNDVNVVRVPGAFELPLAAKKLAATGRYDALIAIGCVLRGETTHYDYVCSETARGLQLAQMDSGLPIIFCVLTCDTLEQAIDRAGLKGGNKGFEAGLAAIEMAQLSRKLSELGERRRGTCWWRSCGSGGGEINVALMSLRTKGREFAMQMLFQWDMSQQDPTKLEKKFWRAAKATDTTRTFANRLFEGAAKEAARWMS